MSGKYILNNSTGELETMPGQEHKKTWLDKHEASLGVPLDQPVLPFKPQEIKPTKEVKPLVVTPFFPDTKKGIDHFTNILKQESNVKLTPARVKEIDKLNYDMKKSARDYHMDKVKPFDRLNPKTYPSTPENRGRLLEADRLTKDIEPERFNDKILKRGKYEPKKRNYWDHFRKTGKILEPTKEEIARTKGPSTWDIIYDSMTPIEKGQWNAEKRKQGMNGKTGDVLVKEEKPKPKPLKPDWDWNLAPWYDYPEDDDLPKPKAMSYADFLKQTKSKPDPDLDNGLGYLLAMHKGKI